MLPTQPERKATVKVVRGWIDLGREGMERREERRENIIQREEL